MLEVAIQVERLCSAVKASVDGNRRLLDESRYRIAASRRRLNPYSPVPRLGPERRSGSGQTEHLVDAAGTAHSASSG